MCTMEEIHACELAMLQAFHDLCEKKGWRYYLSYGTLLGAIRHRGFIPWDDDVDVSMPLNDFLEFVKHGQQELGEKYFIQNCATDPNNPIPWCKIRQNNTTSMAKGYAGFKMHWGISMDIFPIVAAKEGRLNKKMMTETVRKIDSLAIIPFKKYLKQEIPGNVLEESELPREKQLEIMHDLMAKTYSDPRNSKLVVELDGAKLVLRNRKVIYGDFEARLYEFEGRQFYGPLNPHKYLRHQYGDYIKLPPKRYRKGHDIYFGETIWDLENSYEKYVTYEK